MALPEQVRVRAERANQLIAEMNGQAPAPIAPPVEPPTEPPAPAPAPSPNEPPPQEPPAPPAPAPAPADPEATWEHKYRSLQGVLNVEKGKWEAKERVYQERIATLEAQSRAPAPAPTPAPAAAPATAQFTEDELARYGPDLLNLIASKAGAMANEIVTRKLAELNPTLERTQQQVNQIGQAVYQSKEQEFWGELAKAVPDHQQVNASHEWLVWLGQSDELTGIPRQRLLDTAANALDHKRVAKLFEVFKREHGQAAAPAQAPSAPAPAMPPISPSPRTVGHASAPTPREPEAPSVKRSEIAVHYRRALDPTYKASPEYAAMETRIAQASRTGRVFEG
jgi:hypothetical protein